MMRWDCRGGTRWGRRARCPRSSFPYRAVAHASADLDRSLWSLHRSSGTLSSLGKTTRDSPRRTKIAPGHIRCWLELPSSRARKTHLRGGLSPAALRRVQLYVEANLERTIQLAEL